MAEIGIAVVILLILIVLWVDSIWLRLVIGGIATYVLHEELSPGSVKYGAGWICNNKDDPYMERCVNDPRTGLQNRWECEISCLKDSERTATYENVKKHILDMGITLPIPSVFLYNIEHNAWLKREYESFIAHPSNYSNFILFFSIPAQIVLMRKLVPVDVQVSGILVMVDMSNLEVLRKKTLGNTPQHARIEIERLEAKASNADIVSDRFIPLDPESAAALRMNGIEHYQWKPLKQGRELILVSSVGEFNHANTLIVEHNDKRVLHIEPNVGTLSNNAIAKLMLAINKWVRAQSWWSADWSFNKLEWILEACPLAMQSVDKIEGDGYCQTWSKFMALVYLLNPNKHPTSVFGHLLFMQEHTSELLLKFMFYVWKTLHAAEFDASGAKYFIDRSTKTSFESRAEIFDAFKRIREIGEDEAYKRIDLVELLLKILQDIDAEIDVLSANMSMQAYDEINFLTTLAIQLPAVVTSSDIGAALQKISQEARVKAQDSWFRDRILGRIRDYENQNKNQCALV